MIHVAPHPEWHEIFEALGYALGFAWYRRARAAAGDVIGEEQRWSVIAASVVGALVGSRVLGLWKQSPHTWITISQLITPGSGGKTIVGGLLGGWLGVEMVKKIQGIHTRTGDLFAIPLCVGIAVGRLGCFFAGLADDTFGVPTSLPWGVDFGDGVSRHPTQAYEIVFCIMLAGTLHYFHQRPHENGLLFRIFLAAYLTWRLVIDFLKPQRTVVGLSLIQWACCVGLAFLLLGLREKPLLLMPNRRKRFG